MVYNREVIDRNNTRMIKHKTIYHSQNNERQNPTAEEERYCIAKERKKKSRKL
jgi:hypothetical protein